MSGCAAEEPYRIGELSEKPDTDQPEQEVQGGSVGKENDSPLHGWDDEKIYFWDEDRKQEWCVSDHDVLCRRLVEICKEYFLSKAGEEK